MLKQFLEKSAIARKEFFIVFFLLFNAFTWHYVAYIMIDNVVIAFNLTRSENIIWAAHFVALIGSSIIGSMLQNKVNRLNLIYFWMIFGTIASSLPALFNNFTLTHVMILSILWGVSFGVGMPSCLAYFADCTLKENRGLTSGIVFLVTNLCAAFFATLFGMFDLTVDSMLFSIWRGSGLAIFFLKPEQRAASKTKNNASFISILRDKSFALYFVAWLMFCFVDRFETEIFTTREDILEPDFYSLMLVIEATIASFFAFIGGLLCDLIGRKRVVIYGFVTLGLAYAIIGISPVTSSWYFYSIIDGIAAGILWVTFILILWGDLSKGGSSEKYYAIGSTPFFISNLIPIVLNPIVMLIPPSAAFSLASFFLFVAVLPLLYAPETLPEKKIELRRLRKYVKKAKETREEYEEKTR